MSNINLDSSVKIIDSIGRTELPNGKKFEDHFTFNGVSYWKVYESYNILYSISSLENFNKFQLLVDFGLFGVPVLVRVDGLVGRIRCDALTTLCTLSTVHMYTLLAMQAM